ncbi:MAG: hypothetical protein ACRC11_00445, partial [Xenococcaceae cyanobacterium]
QKVSTKSLSNLVLKISCFNSSVEEKAGGSRQRAESRFVGGREKFCTSRLPIYPTLSLSPPPVGKDVAANLRRRIIVRGLRV